MQIFINSVERLNSPVYSAPPCVLWVKYLLCGYVQGVTSTYSPQTVYSIIPATATRGSNVVYQQSAAASDSIVRGDASSAFYYPPPYMQMASSSVHHINHPSSCAVPGILVQGPPPPMQIFSASSHPQHDTFQAGNAAACSKTDGLRAGRSQPAVQVYIPPAQRQ